MFCLSHSRWVFSPESEILDFPLIIMLLFRGESCTQTPKQALSFNWIGTTKDHLSSMFVKSSKQAFGKICEIVPCWRCAIPLCQFILFLGAFSLDVSLSFRYLICPLVFRFFSLMPLFSWTKTKSHPNSNFGSCLGRLYLF